MRKLVRSFGSLIVISLVLATSLLAQDKDSEAAHRPPPVTNPQVRASFGYCATGDLACESANRVRQNSPAQYVHGVDGVGAEFNLASGTRDLTINMLTSQRTATLDFRRLVNIGAVMPAWVLNSPVQTDKIFVNVLGAYYAKQNCPATSTECHYQARINVGGWQATGDSADYAVLWNPATTNPRPVNTPDPTSYVDVHYIRNDGTSEVFIITPIMTAAGFALSGLEQTMRKSVKGAGQYDMPFRLEVRPK